MHQREVSRKYVPNGEKKEIEDIKRILSVGVNCILIHWLKEYVDMNIGPIEIIKLSYQ